MIGEYSQWSEEYTQELNAKISKALEGDRETSIKLLQEAGDYLTSAGRPIYDVPDLSSVDHGEVIQEIVHPNLMWYAGVVLHRLANGSKAEDILGKRRRGPSAGIRHEPEIMAVIIEEMKNGNIKPTKIVEAVVDKGITTKSTCERVIAKIKRDIAPRQPFFRVLFKD